MMMRNYTMKTSYERYGVECYEGWRSLYEPLIQAIENHQGEVLQVKEKFGALRVYYRLPTGTPEEVKQRLFQMKSDAENMSTLICEVCGESGELIEQQGWYRVRCKEHLDYLPE